jgi:hypothetical protein
VLERGYILKRIAIHRDDVGRDDVGPFPGFSEDQSDSWKEVPFSQSYGSLELRDGTAAIGTVDVRVALVNRPPTIPFPIDSHEIVDRTISFDE